MSCDIKIGTSGTLVTQLQKFLASQTYGGGKPYYVAKIDGQYGNYTKGALTGIYKGGVLLWQKHHSLVADGYAGPITTAKMSKYGFSCVVTNPTQKPTLVNSNQDKAKIEQYCGAYSTPEGFISNLKRLGVDWKNYENDIYTFIQELIRAKSGKPMNCSDLSGLVYHAWKALGFEVHYIRLQCKSGGHIILELIRNGRREWIDPSAMLHSGYAWGKGWCYDRVDDPRMTARDPPFLREDDGIT
jgi:hypothetical protein